MWSPLAAGCADGRSLRGEHFSISLLQKEQTLKRGEWHSLFSSLLCCIVYLICCRVSGHCEAPMNIFHMLYPWFLLVMRNLQISADGCPDLRCSTTHTHKYTDIISWKELSLKCFYFPPSPAGNQNQRSWGLICHHRIQTWAAASRRVLDRSSSPAPYVSQWYETNLNSDTDKGKVLLMAPDIPFPVWPFLCGNDGKWGERYRWLSSLWSPQVCWVLLRWWPPGQLLSPS